MKQALIDDEVGLFEWSRKGKTVALDIARGLHFLHSCDVVHRCACFDPHDSAADHGSQCILLCHGK